MPRIEDQRKALPVLEIEIGPNHTVMFHTKTRSRNYKRKYPELIPKYFSEEI